MVKYIAMDPSGVWLVFDEQPILRMSGWDGKIVATLDYLSPKSCGLWASTLEAIPIDYYNQFYKEKEL